MHAVAVDTGFAPRDAAAKLVARERGHGTITIDRMLPASMMGETTFLSWLGHDARGPVVLTASVDSATKHVVGAFQPATDGAAAAVDAWVLSSESPDATVVSHRRVAGSDLPAALAVSGAALDDCDTVGVLAGIAGGFAGLGPISSAFFGGWAEAICRGPDSPPGFFENPPYVHWFGNDLDPYGQQSKHAVVYADSNGYASHVADFEIILPHCAPTYSDCRLPNGQLTRTRLTIRYYWPNGAVQTVGVGYNSSKSYAYITQQYAYLPPDIYPMFVTVRYQVEGTIAPSYLGSVYRALEVRP